MSTYNEMTSIVLDELKLVSDDSHFNEEHVLFLLDKYRAFILKQRYTDIKKEIPESNYQTVCLDLEEVESIEGVPCAGPNYMRSVQKVPDMLTISTPKVTTLDFFSGNFAFTNNERFKYVGSNPYLAHQVYATLSPSKHIYMRSNNPQLFYLKKIKVTGVFEKAMEAAALQCPDEEGNTICDIRDMEYPLEEGLIPPVVELIVKELGGEKYAPADNENNANDDLERLSSYIARNLKDRRT